MKKVLTLLLLLLSKLNTAQAQHNNLEKLVAIQQAELRRSQLPVGSVVPSILTEGAFQSLMGKNWVLMKGQAIEGTLLSKVSGLSTLPNLVKDGKFLRQALSNETLATEQKQATAANGLKVEGAAWKDSQPVSTSSVTPTINNAWMTDNPADLPPYTHAWPLAGGMAGVDHYYKITENSPVSQKAHDHTIDRNSLAHGHKLGSDDSETRPTNISINYFIRIN